ncbi:MAG: ribonuclease HI family protein [Candidatus Lokiarchaeota archaeon]|nr:ribonuclease HI family protein [Candidatus Lokiarchaeota archaeon]
MSKSISKDEELRIYVDGASRGNPGPAAWAYLYLRNGKIIKKNSGFIGKNTNNVAEYNAIINALKNAEDWNKLHIKLYSDSQLVIRQIKGQYRVKKEYLANLYEKVVHLLKKYKKVEFIHVNRENPFIQKCDTMCNECLNNEGA